MFITRDRKGSANPVVCFFMSEVTNTRTIRLLCARCVTPKRRIERTRLTRNDFLVARLHGQSGLEGVDRV